MPFRFYIVSSHDGTVRGTNDETVARSFSSSEDDWVIDSEKNLWLMDEEIFEEGDQEIEEFGKTK